MTAPPPVGVVLAAGRSQRMGMPKALVPWQGVPLLTAHLRAFRGAGSTRSLVVVGDDAVRLVPLAAAEAAEWVRNVAPARGPFSSLLLALVQAERLRWSAAPLWVTPVDVPCASPRVLSVLERHARDAGDALWAVVPCVKGRGGHPVLLTAEGARLLLALPGPPSQWRLDHVLALWGSATRRVEVGDRSVLRNLNTREDVRAAEAPAASCSRTAS